MKLVAIDNPVRADWLADQGYRLDPSPYLSGAFEARKLLERFPQTEPLMTLTQNGRGIFHAGRVSRKWVTDPDHGVPFFSSTDIMEADFSNLPMVSQRSVEKNPKLLIRRDWSLITRSGTIGRMAYARPDIDGFACSEDVLRVVAEPSKILPGYLYAFLSSRFGIPMITSQASGSIIKHIEPRHIADLPVPRFGEETETRIHDLIQEAADLRSRFQVGVQAATKDLFESAGLPELADYSWHKQPRATGAATWGVDAASLRALNYDARALRIMERIRSVPHRTLGEVCAGGELRRGNRFTRITSEDGHGYQMIGQEQLFWLRPEDKWIALPHKKAKELKAKYETVLIACQGLLTERSLIGRAGFLPDSWRDRYLFSEHLLRVTPGSSDLQGAFLFAFLRSEASFRVMRSLCAGTGPQDIHSALRQRVPVPECTPADRERIAETVRQAYRDRDAADDLEDRALELLDEAVREAAR
ncbi:restriction endonuclease subunit S [Glycomyces albus]